MTYSTLISTAELAEKLSDPDWAIVDCRFSLDGTERGRRDYLAAHIPGALYAHLDGDLSSPILPGVSGRHPLPGVETFAQTLGNWGIGPGVQVVAYDDFDGAIAARLWWMLRWLGHEEVAVLDGGWPLWKKEGRPTLSGSEFRSARQFVPRLRPEMVADVEDVEAERNDPDGRLFDSRSAERYRGENETIDPVAGHISGAVSVPYADNLGPDGLFLSPAILKARFELLLKEKSPQEAIFYCGSGVSAAHNLLAMTHAGLGDSKLYVGSWSEWITDPSRAIATGSRS